MDGEGFEFAQIISSTPRGLANFYQFQLFQDPKTVNFDKDGTPLILFRKICEFTVNRLQRRFVTDTPVEIVRNFSK